MSCSSDVSEVCPGDDVKCPVDAKVGSGTECRGSLAECDAAESCDGATNNCPADAFKPEGTACGDGTDVQCNNPDTCDDLGNCSVNWVDESCSDGQACTNDDSCSNGACVGDSVPACVIVEQSGTPDENLSLKLTYNCEGGNEVSITGATFTRDGFSLTPFSMSFSCPPEVDVELPIEGVPNDFSATVNINGFVGECNIPIGADITAVSFDLDANNNVVCFRGEGSAAVLHVLPIAAPPPGGGPRIGGEYSTIDSTTLLVSGMQSNLSWMIPVAVSIAGVTAILVRWKF